MVTFARKFLPMLVTSGVAGIILAILSPFGTDQFPLTHRLLFWVGMCIAGGLGAWIIEALLSRIEKPLPVWSLALGQSLGATFMVAMFFAGLGLATNAMPPFARWPLLLFYIWVISIVISAIGMLIRQTRLPEGSSRPALYDRMKPGLRSAEIYALSAEDHYVRVMTSKGDDLILMRLSDAIKEVAPLPGLSPHRSWWVSEAGVKQVKKSNGKLSLVLNNESITPVSRNKHSTIKDAGWI